MSSKLKKAPKTGPLHTLFANMSAKANNHNGDLLSVAGDTIEGAKKGGKRLSVERIYQKKTQLEHILLRPDTYIGSVEPVTQQMWVYDNAQGMVQKEITYVPGLYKIFDEILVNAADNKQRDPERMDCVKIEIEPENNKISIYNNGKGIPIVEHKDEKMFVPSLIFGHLLTSSNYNDEEKKVTGGRNGYGAKLCNIFSDKFVVETSSSETKQRFKQSWAKNMGKAHEPQIEDYKGEDYTKITFYPDLSKFKMKELDEDIVSLMSRRAYDIAGTCKGVKVFLNGKRLPVKSFKDYVELYLKGKEDEIGNPLKSAYEVVSRRWEIAVAMSEKGFQQVSFANSIATTKGGRHVDYISDQIVTKLVTEVKKKNKAGIAVKPFQIRNHLWVFVNCLIENPTFDSQTKENMTLQSKNFGSKCTPTDKFFKVALTTGVIESIMSWVKFKAESQLEKKCTSRKTQKLKGIAKLEDANHAGTKGSIDCTLILTEGDSAKTLAIAGLGVIGRDKYGVFPLRGKLLNVREASHKQILENVEINNLIKIMGLQYKKKYNTVDDLKSLRYGRLMIMTDQDADGSHIKGLLINFIHHNWPSLLKLPFLEEFITPILKLSKGKTNANDKWFYSLPEFDEWCKTNTDHKSWKKKYYKGLGTSTSVEAKMYFGNLQKHRIRFKYGGDDDDHSVQLAFSKKMVEQRKDWLTNSMEDRKRRRELGLPEVVLYKEGTTYVSFKDFINKELILFSNLDNERSIPSMMDGLKPGQRKVMFTCFKRNDKREVKVAQLAGSVGELSAYHHGEASLMSTIVNLAQNYIGSNNINLLQPRGQFGTRVTGGKDSASPRYIFTLLSDLARKLFSSLDEPLLNHLYDDGSKIEPEYYVPIIPVLLVNGTDGIGTGWSTKIPNYNPKDIIANLRLLLNGEEVVEMKPWFKGFRGTITQVDNQRYVTNGEISILDNNKIEITELPVRTWIQTYKENVLEPMLHGTEKIPSCITNYDEHNTDTTVRFVVTLTEATLMKAEDMGIHKFFKLQSTITNSTMVLFDHNGCIHRYESPEEIIREFFEIRFEYYNKRKAYVMGMLEAESSKLENQGRFILEKIEGKINFENKKMAEFVRTLIERGYDSDPVKAWKAKIDVAVTNVDAMVDSDDEKQEEEVTNISGGQDFNYLLDLSSRSYLKEKVLELAKKRNIKKSELEHLRGTSVRTLYENDLSELEEELKRIENLEKEVELEEIKKMKTSLRSKNKKDRDSAIVFFDTLPRENSRRIEASIDYESYKSKPSKLKKFTKVADKNDYLGDDVMPMDEDEDIPLSARIGTSPQIIDEKKNKQSKVTKGKQTTLNFKPTSKASENNIKSSPKKAVKNGKKKRICSSGSEDELSDAEPVSRKPSTKGKKVTSKKASPKKTSKKGEKKRNPWSDSEEEEEDDDDDDLTGYSDEDDYEVEPRKTKPKRTASTKATFQFDDTDESINNGTEHIKSVGDKNGATNPPKSIPSQLEVDDSSNSGTDVPKNSGDKDDLVSFDTTTDLDSTQKLPENHKSVKSKSDSEDSLPSVDRKAVRTSEELFDSIFSKNPEEKVSKNVFDDDTFGETDDLIPVVKNKPIKDYAQMKGNSKLSTKTTKQKAKAVVPSKKRPKAKSKFSDSDSEDVAPKKKVKKVTKKKTGFSDSDDEIEEYMPFKERVTDYGRRAKTTIKYNFDSDDD